MQIISRIILSVLVLCACFTITASDLNRSGFTVKSEHWADSLLHKLSTEQKIGQLFMLEAYSNWTDDGNKKFKSLIERYQPGGVIFFQGTKEKQLQLIDDWRKVVTVPLLIGMDAEWGTSMRLQNEMWFPKAMQLGAVKDNHLIEQIGLCIGEQCGEAGVHINFAPVLDINSNPQNPVINYRSFGEDKERVADKTYAFFKGLQQAGIVAVGKHFPGHGNTSSDSHYQLPVLTSSKDELYKNELYPFQQAARFGIGGLMTGHLSVPSIDETGTPASLSPMLVDAIINKEWHFKGLIVSDALNMKAVNSGIRNHYLKAFLAGNDILLFPANIKEATEQIHDGLNSGTISMSDLNARVLKILQQKYVLQLHKSMENGTFNETKAQAVVDRVVGQSLTVLRNENNTLPIRDLTKKSVVISFDNNNKDQFREMLSMYGDFQWMNLKDKEGNLTTDIVGIGAYDRIILPIYGSVSSMKNNYGLNKLIKELVAFLPAEKEIIGVLFANPYALRNTEDSFLDKFDGFVVAYDNRDLIHEKAAQLIVGGISGRGELPVSLSDKYPVGFGLKTDKSRVGFTSFLNEGFSPLMIEQIDSVVNDAISDEATPGCQVLVAKNGNVVLNKCYGFHTYDHSVPVVWHHLYDIASVTKAICTTPIIMDLVEHNQLDLNQQLADFPGVASDAFKQNIKIKELLLHQSGLQPFIPYYLYVLDEAKLKEGLFFNRETPIFSIPLGAGLFANKKVSFKKDWVSRKPEAGFPYKVTNNMYLFGPLKDSIFTWIDTSRVDSSKLYRYSDLNFHYLKAVSESLTGESIDAYAESHFYKQLGMNSTLFNPLDKFDKSEIVPTEMDLLFRKGLVHGQVHDQSAAMQNGVGGHAGLFSNSVDLVKFSQMLLNGGTYGGHTYFNWKTVDFFTHSGNSENRRALGFDKPEADSTKISPVCPSASMLSYGHSGFTGTMVWIDPAYELIYIFLSNRIHPNAYNRKLIDNNVRTKIQELIYQNMHDFN